MKSKYRNLKFETDKAFKNWLDETATDKIELIDKGQDLTTIWIDQHGEILHCNLQTSVWCGKFVCLSELREGDNIFISGIGKDKISFTEMDFVLESKTKLMQTGTVNVKRKRGQMTISTTLTN